MTKQPKTVECDDAKKLRKLRKLVRQFLDTTRGVIRLDSNDCTIIEDFDELWGALAEASNWRD
jgi:hypothetical protein